MSISDLLQDEVKYQKPYHLLFTHFKLSVSENFAYTETKLLPVFSKKQKAGEQILIEEDRWGLKATLISVKEGEIFKKKIQEGLKNTWLYLPDGHMHIMSSQGDFPKDQKKLQEILFEVNFFNGNIKYLLEHKEEFFLIIQKNPDHKELVFHFLELKSHENSMRQGALKYLKKFIDSKMSN